MSATQTERATRAEQAVIVERPISLATTLWQRGREHDLTGLSAEMAYRFLFALFPFALFLASVAASVAGVLGFGDPTGRIIDGLGDNLPSELAGTVRQELENVIGQQRPGLATFGALLALWAATSGTMTVIKAMNRTYDVREDRPLVRRYLLGIGLTLAGSVGIIIAFVTIVGGTVLTERIVSDLGLEGSWATITLLRWPLAFGLLVLGTSIIYRVGPNLTPSWRAAATGAVVFSIGWLVATFAFALYVANVANYGATYGTLGGVLVLMIWLYLTGLALLVGAEVVAMIVHRTEPERIEARQAEITARAAAVAGDVVDRTRELADHTIGKVSDGVDETESDADRRGAASGRT